MRVDILEKDNSPKFEGKRARIGGIIDVSVFRLVLYSIGKLIPSHGDNSDEAITLIHLLLLFINWCTIILHNEIF
jgi:hypothetical protein